MRASQTKRRPGQGGCRVSERERRPGGRLDSGGQPLKKIIPAWSLRRTVPLMTKNMYWRFPIRCQSMCNVARIGGAFVRNPAPATRLTGLLLLIPECIVVQCLGLRMRRRSVGNAPRPELHVSGPKDSSRTHRKPSWTGRVFTRNGAHELHYRALSNQTRFRSPVPGGRKSYFCVGRALPPESGPEGRSTLRSSFCPLASKSPERSSRGGGYWLSLIGLINVTKKQKRDIRAYTVPKR